MSASGMMDKVPMTRAGFNALDDELKQLKSVERGAVIRAIAEGLEQPTLRAAGRRELVREIITFTDGQSTERVLAELLRLFRP